MSITGGGCPAAARRSYSALVRSSSLASSLRDAATDCSSPLVRSFRRSCSVTGGRVRAGPQPSNVSPAARVKLAVNENIRRVAAPSAASERSVANVLVFISYLRHQRNHAQSDLARADLLPTEGVRSLAVGHHGHVVILVDDHHRHEALARIGQRDRHPPGIKVEHRQQRIERVAVRPHAGFFSERQIARVVELPEPALLREHREVHVCLGANEVVGGNRY